MALRLLFTKRNSTRRSHVVDRKKERHIFFQQISVRTSLGILRYLFQRKNFVRKTVRLYVIQSV